MSEPNTCILATPLSTTKAQALTVPAPNTQSLCNAPCQEFSKTLGQFRAANRGAPTSGPRKALVTSVCYFSLFVYSLWKPAPCRSQGYFQQSPVSYSSGIHLFLFWGQPGSAPHMLFPLCLLTMAALLPNDVCPWARRWGKGFQESHNSFQKIRPPPFK